MKDIGIYVNSAHDAHPVPVRMIRDNINELKNVHKLIVSKKLTSSDLSFAAPCVLQQALQNEHDSNCFNAYIEIEESMVLQDLNVITSYVVYKIKNN